MRSIYNILAFLTGILFIAAMLFLFFVGGRYLMASYEDLTPEWSSTVLIFSVVAVLCTIILARALNSVARKADKTIHPEKAIVYGNFVEIRNRMTALPAGDEIQIKNLQNQRKQMMLWAADDVLKDYLKLEKLIDSDAPEQRILGQVERVILAMRRDLGNNNWGILKGDLINIFQKV